MLDFLKIKSGIEAVGAQARDLAGKIEAKKREREHLQDAPLPRDDYLDMLCDCVDVHADDATEKLKQATAPSMSGFAETLNMQILSQNGQMGRGGHVFPGPIYLLFREPIKDALRAEIGSWDWPSDAGPPRSQRPAMIAKLDAEIVKLEAEEGKIRDAANAAGVNLVGLAVRPPKGRRP